jgi:cysteinyl-tRNA synthetase
MLNSVRSELLYSSSSLDLAKAVLGKLENFIFECNSILYGAKPVSLDGSQELWELLAATETEIENVLCDDFSTSDAIDLLLKFVSEFHRRWQTDNEAVLTNESIDFKLVLASQSLVQDFLTSLGFTLGSRKQQDVKDSALVQPLLEELLEFRQSVRAFSLAFDEEDKARRKVLIQERQQLMEACDQVRLRLGTYGIHLKDHGKSSSWVLKSGR